VVLVGKHKFDVTKHVVWPGRLIDLEIADIHLVPIDRARIDITAEIFDAQLVTLEYRRVPSAPAEEPGSLLAKIRPDLLDLDRGRHVIDDFGRIRQREAGVEILAQAAWNYAPAPRIVRVGENSEAALDLGGGKPVGGFGIRSIERVWHRQDVVRGAS